MISAFVASIAIVIVIFTQLPRVLVAEKLNDIKFNDTVDLVRFLSLFKIRHTHIIERVTGAL